MVVMLLPAVIGLAIRLRKRYPRVVRIGSVRSSLLMEMMMMLVWYSVQDQEVRRL